MTNPTEEQMAQFDADVNEEVGRILIHMDKDGVSAPVMLGAAQRLMAFIIARGIPPEMRQEAIEAMTRQTLADMNRDVTLGFPARTRLQ